MSMRLSRRGVWFNLHTCFAYQPNLEFTPLDSRSFLDFESWILNLESSPLDLRSFFSGSWISGILNPMYLGKGGMATKLFKAGHVWTLSKGWVLGVPYHTWFKGARFECIYWRMVLLSETVPCSACWGKQRCFEDAAQKGLLTLKHYCQECCCWAQKPSPSLKARLISHFCTLLYYYYYLDQAGSCRARTVIWTVEFRKRQTRKQWIQIRKC